MTPAQVEAWLTKHRAEQKRLSDMQQQAQSVKIHGLKRHRDETWWQKWEPYRYEGGGHSGMMRHGAFDAMIDLLRRLTDGTKDWRRFGVEPYCADPVLTPIGACQYSAPKYHGDGYIFVPCLRSQDSRRPAKSLVATVSTMLGVGVSVWRVRHVDAVLTLEDSGKLAARHNNPDAVVADIRTLLLDSLDIPGL